MEIVKPSVKCVASTKDALRLIESAGRVCHQSEPEGNSAAFVRKLIALGHESVLEHATATFRIVCDRGVSHELVRHRIGFSFCQESTRYCKYKDGIRVIEPPGLSSDQRALWYRQCKEAEETYLKMLANGCIAQIARSVLPNALRTELVITANFRAWRHFLKLRTAKAAHPQMREIAGMILVWFHEYYPVIVEDISNGR